MEDHNEEESGKYASQYLTHFVGKEKDAETAFRILCKVIKDRRLLPGGSEENWAGNLSVSPNSPFSGNRLFNPGMVCFCDIPLTKMLRIHTQKYSCFGLAFDKEWAAQHRGASPVFYLAEGSCLTDHRYPDGHPHRGTTRKEFFNLAAHDWLTDLASRGGIRAVAYLSRADNMLLWYVLSYCKFFDETLDGSHENNYYMEREWRTIGQVKFEPSDIARVVLPRGFEERFKDEFRSDPCSSCLVDKIHLLDLDDGNPCG